MDQEHIISAIESVLFLHGEPMAVSKLGKTVGISEEETRNGIEGLRKRYAGADSGLALIEHGKSIEIATRPENAPFIEKLFVSDREEGLGKAALEVLSIVAYRGPVSRAKIEAIRGVNCSFSLRNLLLRNLIDRRPNPTDAREYEYFPSFQLLEMLGVGAVEALPEYGTLSADKRLAVLEDMMEKNGEDDQKEIS
jgi:segregation and condensation protein B